MSTTDPNAPTDPDGPELDYSSAVAELDDILLELEDEALDVDVLAERVERASVLIRFCRSRITSARTQVEQIVADLEELGDDE
jgi:exodeoxyribonuclease VII small subunit